MRRQKFQVLISTVLTILAQKKCGSEKNYSRITRRLSTLLCAESVYQFSQTEILLIKIFFTNFDKRLANSDLKSYNESIGIKIMKKSLLIREISSTEIILLSINFLTWYKNLVSFSRNNVLFKNIY